MTGISGAVSWGGGTAQGRASEVYVRIYLSPWLKAKENKKPKS